MRESVSSRRHFRLPTPTSHNMTYCALGWEDVWDFLGIEMTTSEMMVTCPTCREVARLDD